MNDLAGKKIGILGGSFDPIHKGHLSIGEAAYRDFDLDEVWFIPAGHSPNKDENQMTPSEYRARMTELAIAPYPYFKMSRIEIDAAETSYTYRTLTKLKEQYPDTTFYFIMGADSLDYFEEWMHPEIISKKAVLLVAVRSQWDRTDIMRKIAVIEHMFHAEIYPLSCERFDAASREIRQALEQGDETSSELPAAVMDFIREKHLYRK